MLRKERLNCFLTIIFKFNQNRLIGCPYCECHCIIVLSSPYNKYVVELCTLLSMQINNIVSQSD